MPFPDLEPTQICNGTESCYDDTVLERLDDFMISANSYGIKAPISTYLSQIAILTFSRYIAHHQHAQF